MKFEEKFKIILTYAKDKNMPIIYVPKYREFGIRVQDGGTSFIVFSYCPFTGEKLSDSLRDDWFDLIEKMGFEPNSVDIPHEYLSDEWWNKKR